MDVLRWVLRRTARVAPAPEGCSCQEPREKSSPPIPTGVEEAPGQCRRWKCLAFLHRRRPTPSFRLCRRDPAQEGSQARCLWGCWCWKASPQETSPTGQQEASPCLLPADLPTSAEQEMGDPCPASSTSSSACSRGDSSSSPEAPCSLDPATSPLPTDTLSDQLEGEDLAPEAEEKQEDLAEDENDDDDDLTMEEATGKTVMEHLQDGNMTVAKQIRFLRAIPPMCFHAQKIGRDTLDPPGSKAAVAQRIAELLEALPLDSGPSSILSCCLVAVGNLSKLQPALERELESRLLQASMSRIFTMDTANDPNIQALHKSLEEKQDVMLRSLLAASPSTDNLQHTMEHIGFWIRSRDPTERARAMRTSAALLRYANLLPGFDTSSEFPRMGHLVAELGLSITDPAEDIARQAKAGIYWLYQLLLQCRGLNIHEAEQLWSQDVPQDNRLLAYVNTARVGQVFGKIFSEGQRRSFLQSALLATHHPLLRLSQAALLLSYALLGEADQLLGNTLEDVLARIWHQLFALRTLKQVPEVFKSLDNVGSP